MNWPSLPGATTWRCCWKYWANRAGWTPGTPGRCTPAAPQESSGWRRRRRVGAARCPRAGVSVSRSISATPVISPEVADVSVDADRKIRVNRVTVAADVGPIINLSGAENQMQGSVIDGLSTMLDLSVTFENGRVEQSNFDSYPILRMPDAPDVDTHFVQSDFSPTGLGEPALPPLAPAVWQRDFRGQRASHPQHADQRGGVLKSDSRGGAGAI